MGGNLFTAGLADPNLWTNRVYSVDVGLNWYLTQYVKMYLGWEHDGFAQPVLLSPGRSALSIDQAWLRFQVFSERGPDRMRADRIWLCFGAAPSTQVVRDRVHCAAILALFRAIRFPYPTHPSDVSVPESRSRRTTRKSTTSQPNLTFILLYKATNLFRFYLGLRDCQKCQVSTAPRR